MSGADFFALRVPVMGGIMWVRDKNESKAVSLGAEPDFVDGSLYEPLQIEKLAWPKVFFVRLFAPKIYSYQRQQAAIQHRQIIHEVFTPALTAIRAGEPSRNIDFFLNIHLAPERVFTKKRRSLLGTASIKKSLSAAQTFYAPTLLTALAELNSLSAEQARYFGAIQNQLRQIYLGALK